MTGLMVRPPVAGDASFATYASERATILASLERRARLLAASLDALPGISCRMVRVLHPHAHAPPLPRCLASSSRWL
jgi:hypothetical protein